MSLFYGPVTELYLHTTAWKVAAKLGHYHRAVWR